MSQGPGSTSAPPQIGLQGAASPGFSTAMRRGCHICSMPGRDCRERPCRSLRSRLPASLPWWRKFAPRCFTLTATSIRGRSRSRCSCRTGASGCRAFTPGMRGDRRLPPANLPRYMTEGPLATAASMGARLHCEPCSKPGRPQRRTSAPLWGDFSRWAKQARRAFLGGYIKTDTAWSPDLADKVYSTQLWQLTKAWEITQEFELEGEAPHLLGQPVVEPRAWCNTIPADTAPAATHIPNGSAGIGGSALTNEYLSSSWYELQIILNSGNHRHRDRAPVDWVYLIGHFQDLYAQTHQPEPVRLLVAVTKAFQSTDPQLGPDDFS